MPSLFLIISLLASIFWNGQADLINDICSKSADPSLCRSSLTSDPRSRAADIQFLAQIAIENAQSAVTAAISVAKSFNSGVNKAKAEKCIQGYNESIGTLNYCSELKYKGDLNLKASLAFREVATCDNEFGGGEPAQLKQAGTKAQNLVNVLVVISTMFPEGNI